MIEGLEVYSGRGGMVARRWGCWLPPLGARPCRICGDFVLDIEPPPAAPRAPPAPIVTVKGASMDRDDEAESALGRVTKGRVVLAARDVEEAVRVRSQRPGSVSRRFILPTVPTPPNEGRPLTRGDCEGGERPCPWVSCRYHLLLDVDPKTGAIYTSFDGDDFDQIPETCALDVADQGGGTLESIAQTLGLTRERIRQIEAKAQRVSRRMSSRDVATIRELLRHEAPSQDIL